MKNKLDILVGGIIFLFGIGASVFIVACVKSIVGEL
jgi:hypothetical protein